MGRVVELSNIEYRWPGKTSFSLKVPEMFVSEGESVLLLGDSGSGKSTLLSLVCGTVLPDRGSIIIADTEVTKLSSRARDRLRAEKIGVIFQQFNLLPFGTVTDNILLALRFAPQRSKRAGNATKESMRLCEALDLPEGIGGAKASTLSVGQQQRVAAARALIGQPPLIIADEPTSALDANSQAAFLTLLFEQVKANDTSLLMVSHDYRLSDRFDRVIRMDDIAKTGRAAA